MKTGTNIFATLGYAKIYQIEFKDTTYERMCGFNQNEKFLLMRRK